MTSLGRLILPLGSSPLLDAFRNPGQAACPFLDLQIQPVYPRGLNLSPFFTAPLRIIPGLPVAYFNTSFHARAQLRFVEDPPPARYFRKDPPSYGRNVGLLPVFPCHHMGIFLGFFPLLRQRPAWGCSPPNVRTDFLSPDRPFSMIPSCRHFPFMITEFSMRDPDCGVAFLGPQSFSNPFPRFYLIP